MKKYVLLVALLTVGVTAAASAQQSSLASMFDRYDVNGKWGQLPSGQSWGGTTTSVAADGKGTVIVLVRAAPFFRVFTTDGRYVRGWGDASLFNQAHSVHFGPDGAVWATDPNDHVVHKFSPDGRLLMTLGKKAVSGDNTSRDAFNRPNGVAIAANGDIYVSDGYVNSRIVHFDSNGRFVKIIGGTKGNRPGELQLPHGVAIDAQGRIIVGDSDNKRISIFDRDGKFLKTLPGPSRGGTVVTPDGTIYASDVNNGLVSVFKNDQLVDVIKVEGRPHGLSVDPVTADVYTSSTVAEVPNVTKASLKKTATN
jgi:hypothetical protein